MNMSEFLYFILFQTSFKKKEVVETGFYSLYLETILLSLLAYFATNLYDRLQPMNVFVIINLNSQLKYHEMTFAHRKVQM